MQVVVAVLLDNFTAAADEEKQRKAQHKAKLEGRTPVVYAMDPLLAALAHFDTSRYYLVDMSHVSYISHVSYTDMSHVSYTDMSHVSYTDMLG